MKHIILGGAGFIGTNLALQLAEDKNNIVTLVGRNKEHFKNIERFEKENIIIKILDTYTNADFDELLLNQDIVYHLVSSTVPTTSNLHILQEIQVNIEFSINLFESCIRKNIKKVIFVSSGGTVYGKDIQCPINEETITQPITAYGIQKITIEKILYLYSYMYGLDYRIIRLANPYGPFQRPNGVLGAVTTFIYKALKGEKIIVYGDGTVVRDFIYIDDVVRAMLNIVEGENQYRTYNLGSGKGISIKKVLEELQDVLGSELNVEYVKGRSVDIPVNYLDISRYEKCFGKLNPLSLSEGIGKTIDFMKKNF